RLALGDLRGLYDDDGQVLSVHEWPDDVAAMVSGIDVTTASDGASSVTKVRTWDKTKSLDMLMRHLGAYAADKHEHTGRDGGPNEMTGTERAARLQRLMDVLRRRAKT